MNKQFRKNALEKITKQAEKEALIKKVAQDADINSAIDADDYSEKVFQKLLSEIKIDGLED